MAPPTAGEGCVAAPGLLPTRQPSEPGPKGPPGGGDTPEADGRVSTLCPVATLLGLLGLGLDLSGHGAPSLNPKSKQLHALFSLLPAKNPSVWAEGVRPWWGRHRRPQPNSCSGRQDKR